MSEAHIFCILFSALSICFTFGSLLLSQQSQIATQRAERYFMYLFIYVFLLIAWFSFQRHTPVTLSEENTNHQEKAYLYPSQLTYWYEMLWDTLENHLQLSLCMPKVLLRSLIVNTQLSSTFLLPFLATLSSTGLRLKSARFALRSYHNCGALKLKQAYCHRIISDFVRINQNLALKPTTANILEALLTVLLMLFCWGHQKHVDRIFKSHFY